MDKELVYLRKINQNLEKKLEKKVKSNKAELKNQRTLFETVD
jgi:hypothetical protein